MFLSDVSVKRPVLATVANLLLMVVGLGALLRLPVRQYPDIDPPVVSVQTTFSGASSAVMEADVSKRIEEALSGIEGVRIISTVSSDENSRIDVEFNIERNIEFAAADVRDQLGRIRKLLPVGIDDPIVFKASSSSNPVLWIAIKSSARDGLSLTDFSRRNLIDTLSVVPGVSRVQIGGERRYAMRIWLDPLAMASRGITAADVIARLEAENVELPAGRLESRAREMTVRTNTRLSTPEDFRAIVVQDGISGNGSTPPVSTSGRVLLGDIAKIEQGAANYRTGLWIDGENSIGLGIIKQSTANTLEVADGIKAALGKLSSGIPSDISLFYPYDESVFIKASIQEVLKTLAIAIGLVIIVILIFLRSWTATLIPMLAVPVSLLAAAIVMLALGFSINVLTLLAMVLAIGLVVDDAIVVLENVYRRFEQGEPRLLAGFNGSGEVAFAVVATTTVLIAVFLPISFQSGTVGRLQREFGITLAATVGFSAFVALTLAPMLCSKMLRPNAGSGIIGRRVGKVVQSIEHIYVVLLAHALRIRLLIVIGALFIAIIAAILYRNSPKELSPKEDQGFVIIPLEAPQGSTMEATLKSVDQVQKILDPFMLAHGGPVYSVLTIMPSFGAPGTVNSAFIIGRLVNWDKRKISQMELVDRLNPKLSQVIGARAFAINRPSFGLRDFGQSVQVVVEGEEYASVQAWAKILESKARESNHFPRVFDDIDLTKPQLGVTVDRDRAAELGISAKDIGSALGAMYGELKSTTYEYRAEQYDVILQAPAELRSSPESMSTIQVRSKSGKLIPLSAIVTMHEIGGPKELRRLDRRPAVTISASLNDLTLGEAFTWFQEAAAANLPAVAHVSYTGQAKEYQDAVGNVVNIAGITISATLAIYALAFVIVFLVLAAQFESWIHPVIVMIGAPLAAAGGLMALRLTGQSVNVYSQIGLIMLIGLVAKNGILMVEFANQLRDRGQSIPEAISTAARIRLRPILMTSIATIAGSIPLAIAAGAGAEGRRAIGTVIIGGLSSATFLTLFVIPALYAYLARWTRPAGELERRLADMQTQQASSGGKKS